MRLRTDKFKHDHNKSSHRCSHDIKSIHYNHNHHSTSNYNNYSISY
jgi:hypothetical protein